MERYNKYLLSSTHYKEFKDIRKPLLVSTSLFECGVNIQGVNIVFNYDMPEDSSIYFDQVCL